ncbi:LuxR C-terminal-related transcriptional regulator [Arundinibacter roseus]|uniref:Response regulator transcription factor n=1 Tax=Arundinibacter roseus TaxID=2070510 RepID=A0A4R4JV05_9BACT|nr:LuxR C-terminal-related transcriptional regulator [Arundinibacter roseus]TDB58534.1 response regulator transcription factor [Arundinibacter roseus]
MRDFTVPHYDSSSWHQLTHREWEVLLLLADDLDNQDIAERISVSIKSVKNYRNRISDRLQQKGPHVLARYARRNRNYLRELYMQHTGKSPS